MVAAAAADDLATDGCRRWLSSRSVSMDKAHLGDTMGHCCGQGAFSKVSLLLHCLISSSLLSDGNTKNMFVILHDSNALPVIGFLFFFHTFTTYDDDLPFRLLSFPHSKY